MRWLRRKVAMALYHLAIRVGGEENFPLVQLVEVIQRARGYVPAAETASGPDYPPEAA